MDVKKIFVLIFIIPIVFPQTNTANATINMTKIAPKTASINETITITIIIKNIGNYTENLSVYEYPGDIIPVKPNKLMIDNTSNCTFCRSPAYFLWNIDLKPKDEKNISYKIKPKTLGDLIITGTTAFDQNGKLFYSNPVTIKVQCNSNGICEPSLGENYFNCDDCPSGSEDGVCDLIDDGICDPDCKIGSDDCTCNNNGICEWWENSTCIDCGNHHVKYNHNIYIMILFVAIVLILVIALIIKTIKNKQREKEIVQKIENK